MTLKCKRNISSEGLTANRLYPVIAYEINLDDSIVTYQIVDDSGSLSWPQNDRFEVVSCSKEGYIKVDGSNGSLKYLYEVLSDMSFFVDYYLEDEKSKIANRKLEKALISILSNELTTNELLSHLEVVGYQDENTDLLLKSFFLKANENDIINFANMIYDKISTLKNYIVQIIIERLSNYKTVETENIFMELYLNGSSYSEEIRREVDDYLKI